MTTELKIYATLVIGFVATLMIFARRWKNTDKSAGMGIGGWAIFTIFNLWWTA